MEKIFASKKKKKKEPLRFSRRSGRTLPQFVDAYTFRALQQRVGSEFQGAAPWPRVYQAMESHQNLELSVCCLDDKSLTRLRLVSVPPDSSVLSGVVVTQKSKEPTWNPPYRHTKQKSS